MNAGPTDTVNVPTGALEIPTDTHMDTLADIHGSSQISGGVTTCIDRLCSSGPSAAITSRG